MFCILFVKLVAMLVGKFVNHVAQSIPALEELSFGTYHRQIDHDTQEDFNGQMTAGFVKGSRTPTHVPTDAQMIEETLYPSAHGEHFFKPLSGKISGMFVSLFVIHTAKVRITFNIIAPACWRNG